MSIWNINSHELIHFCKLLRKKIWHKIVSKKAALGRGEWGPKWAYGKRWNPFLVALPTTGLLVNMRSPLEGLFCFLILCPMRHGIIYNGTPSKPHRSSLMTYRLRDFIITQILYLYLLLDLCPEFTCTFTPWGSWNLTEKYQGSFIYKTLLWITQVQFSVTLCIFILSA